jgi:hypothetical protein
LLLEMAMVISIIGLISGFFISKTIIANRMKRENVTKNNLDIVVMALASHVANHHRLPRPSLNNDGLESAVGENLANHMGYVPFNTLGIPTKTALDGDARPLIYVVEPFLTTNFVNIYETELDQNSNFCHPILDPKISISGRNAAADVVAFVIDTKDNMPAISNKIYVTVSKNTVWVSRDMILMKYLKGPPAKGWTEAVQHHPAQANDDVFDF